MEIIQNKQKLIDSINYMKRYSRNWGERSLYLYQLLAMNITINSDKPPMLPLTPCPSLPPLKFRVPPCPKHSPPPIPEPVKAKKKRRVRRIKLDKCDEVEKPKKKKIKVQKLEQPDTSYSEGSIIDKILSLRETVLDYESDFNDQADESEEYIDHLDWQELCRWDRLVDFITDYWMDERDFILKLKGQSKHMLCKIHKKLNEMLRVVESRMNIF